MTRTRFLAIGLVGTLSLLAGLGSLYSVSAQQPTMKEGERAPDHPWIKDHPSPAQRRE
jgi:hypothetical protein